MSQHNEIYLYLQDHTTITPMEAFSHLGITKLATRISEMRRKGYNIDVEIVKGSNRHGRPTRYAKYTLGADDDGRMDLVAQTTDG